MSAIFTTSMSAKASAKVRATRRARRRRATRDPRGARGYPRRRRARASDAEGRRGRATARARWMKKNRARRANARGAGGRAVAGRAKTRSRTARRGDGRWIGVGTRDDARREGLTNARSRARAGAIPRSPDEGVRGAPGAVLRGEVLRERGGGACERSEGANLGV